MKRLLEALFTITLVMVIVGTLYAEEQDSALPEEGYYSGQVVFIKSVIQAGGSTNVKERNSYTVTYFTVKSEDNGTKVYHGEKIENGNGKDMSAIIAVVQEAFTSGQMIRVVKRTDPVLLERLYNELEEIEKKLDKLPEERIQRLTALRNELASASKKLYELFKTGQITQEEYIKKIRELYKNYSAAYKEVEEWYAATKEQLHDQIASLKEDIERILSNPELYFVSIGELQK